MDSVKAFAAQYRKALIFAFAVVVAAAVVIAVAVNNSRGGAIDAMAPRPPVEAPYVPATPAPAATPEPSPPAEEYPAEEYPEDEIPYVGPLGLLTGLPIEEAYANRRPIAVVVNNTRGAWPQSGLPYADVIYEIALEGNVTRLLAVFQTALPERVGPVRSTRDFFTDMAMNHDAVFVHHGGTPSGYERLRNYIDARMDGMYLAAVFWRDRSFPAWTGRTGQRAREHSSYTGRENILAHMEARNMRDSVTDSGGIGFNFGEIPDGVAPKEEATFITVPFSTPYVRHFEFVPEYGHYIVQNSQGGHMDAETELPLVTNNILVKLTRRHGADGLGHVMGTLVGEGRGYFATGGQIFAVRWEKDAIAAPARWYFECGTELVLTPGKTWISIFNGSGTVRWE